MCELLNSREILFHIPDEGIVREELIKDIKDSIPYLSYNIIEKSIIRSLNNEKIVLLNNIIKPSGNLTIMVDGIIE